MSHLNEETIRYLTQLSRIDCNEKERTALLKDLENILQNFKQLNEVNTDNVSPCNHVLEEVTNVMREDLVKDMLPRDVFLANAPSKVSGLIRVPTVIKRTS